MEFGGPRGAVGKGAFDLERKLAYAATGKQGDPMFAFGLADPADLRLLSQAPDVSGDLSLFRLVDRGQFLLAVSREPPERCPGQPPNPVTGDRPAVSLIDVRDATAIALVQRRCLDAVAGDWLTAAAEHNLRQAHWLAEQHTDGDRPPTLPVHAFRRVDDQSGSWSHRVETAVGLMTWDPGKQTRRGRRPSRHG